MWYSPVHPKCRQQIEQIEHKCWPWRVSAEWRAQWKPFKCSLNQHLSRNQQTGRKWKKEKSTSQEDIKRIRVIRSNKSKNEKNTLHEFRGTVTYNLTDVLWGDILHLLLSVSCQTFLLFCKKIFFLLTGSEHSMPHLNNIHVLMLLW